MLRCLPEAEASTCMTCVPRLSPRRISKSAMLATSVTVATHGVIFPLLWSNNRPRLVASARASHSALDRQAQNQQRYSFRLYGKHVRHERQAVVKQYFKDVLNNGCLDLLDSMVVDRVAYSEKNIYEEQFTGRPRLRRILAEYQHAYPAMQYNVVNTTADEYGDNVVACWTAGGSNLGSRMNIPASGQVSRLSGMTMFTFDSQGMITEMVVFRTALAEEAAAISLEWD